MPKVKTMLEKKQNKKFLEKVSKPKKETIKTEVENSQEPITEPKIETRGRAKKGFEDNFQFIDISQYVVENEKKAEAEPLNTDTSQPQQPQQTQAEQIKQAAQNEVLIDITAENLDILDSVLSSICEKLFKVIGFEVELQPMSEKDLELWAKITPPISLTQSWRNSLMFFLFTKLK